MPVFPRLPASGRPVGLSCVSWTGLGVSPGGFFKNGIIQSKVRYDTLQSEVFLLQFLETAGLVDPHATVVFSPAVISEVTDADLFTDYSDGISLA